MDFRISKNTFSSMIKISKNISGEVGANGTGSWTVQEAHEKNIPVPLIEDSVKIREWSTRTGGNYTTKIIALLRNHLADMP